MVSLSKFLIIALIGLTLLSSVYAASQAGGISNGQTKIGTPGDGDLVLLPEIKVSHYGIKRNEFLFNASGSKCYFEEHTIRGETKKVKCNFTEWSLNYGDGSQESGAGNPSITTHTYSDKKIYGITLTVYVGDLSKTKNNVVNLLNKPPVANAGSNKTTLVNESINFDASKSYDSDGTIVSYSWDFGDGATGKGVAASHSYSSPGNYTTILTVTDNDGATSTANISVKVLEKPIAVIKTIAAQGYAPLSVLFNANNSYDVDGKIISYYWDFGDGQNSTQIETTHTYTSPGEYNATLTITDNDNLTSTAYILINATQNQNPIILSFNANTTNESAPLDVEFKGAATDNENLSYTLIFDVNNYSNNITGRINSTESTLGEHIYTSIGNYTAKLIVEDGLGGVNSSDIIIEVVNATNNTGNGNNSTIINQPPVANFTYINSTYYTFSFTDLSTDSDGNITSWLWNFGDGTTSNQQNPEHNFAKTTANYTVTLTVTDNNGSQSNYSQTIKVIKPPSNNNQNSYNGGGWMIWTPKKNKTNENITANVTNGTIAGNQTNKTSNSTASETANQNGSSVQKAIPITTAGSGTAVTGLATGIFNDSITPPILTFLSIAAIGLFAFGKIGLGKGAVSIRRLIKTRSIKRKK